MVGCYCAPSSCVLCGMEGTISSTTCSTLSSSSWWTDGKLLHQNGAAGCHTFAQSSERWATTGAGGGSRSQQHCDTFSLVCATSTRRTWRKGNPLGPIDVAAKGIFDAGVGFFFENMAAIFCKGQGSGCKFAWWSAVGKGTWSCGCPDRQGRLPSSVQALHKPTTTCTGSTSNGAINMEF